MLDELYQCFLKSGAPVQLRRGVEDDEYIEYRYTIMSKSYIPLPQTLLCIFQIRHIRVGNKDYLDITNPRKYSPFRHVRIDLKLLIDSYGNYEFLPVQVIEFFSRLEKISEKDSPAINYLIYLDDIIREPVYIYQVDSTEEGYYEESIYVSCSIRSYELGGDYNKKIYEEVIISATPGSEEFTFTIQNILKCSQLEFNTLSLLLNWEFPLSNCVISEGLVKLIYETTVQENITKVDEDTLVKMYNNYYRKTVKE